MGDRSFFYEHGAFLGVERKAVTAGVGSECWDEGTVQTAMERTMASWKAEIGFKEGPITVEPFFLKEYSIGIEEFPLDLADYLSDPSKYPPEDQAEFLKDIKRWKDEGNFVFFWSESYHLDRKGNSL